MTPNSYDESTFGNWFDNGASSASGDVTPTVNASEQLGIAPDALGIAGLLPAEISTSPLADTQPEFFGL